MARAWKILKDGALERAVGVRDAKVVELAREVREAFIERFTRGRKMVVVEPMKDLIRVLEENTRRKMESEDARAEFGLDEDEEELEVLQEPGATVREIAELEKRLGVQLPTDYKEFLSISNGLGRSWSGILLDPPLHSAEEVRWEDEEDYFTDLTLEILPLGIFATCRDFPGLVQYENWPKVERTVQIGQEDIDSVWLLPPATVAKVRDAYLRIVDGADAPEEIKTTVLNAVRSFVGSRERFEGLEWCILHWMSGGAACMSAYPSFGDYIAEKARSSATDHWAGEEWERGCFAYGCR